jgi:hypothetical protein
VRRNLPPPVAESTAIRTVAGPASQEATTAGILAGQLTMLRFRAPRGA